MPPPRNSPGRKRVRRVAAPASGAVHASSAAPASGAPVASSGAAEHPAWLRWSWLLLPLVSVALGGATARWSQGIVLALLGGLLLAAPPRVALGKWLNLILLSLALLALLAFLPASWFSRPVWRAALVDDFETVLPSTLSPQPWLTAESAAVFLAGLAWFYRMATVNWTVAERLRAGRAYAGGVVLLAIVFLALLKAQIAVPIWPAERHFGPFPNRNQTADFLAVGALIVLGCVHTAWRARRRIEAGAWMVGWLVVAVADFTSFSRAGVVLLFFGAAFYMVSQERRARRHAAAMAKRQGEVAGSKQIDRWRTVALGVSLVALLLSAFLMFGGETVDRLKPASGEATVNAVTTEFRLRIQADALHLIAASPWCGIGLGNFDALFQPFRVLSALPSRAIHPESDWLWMTAELGWPSFVLVLAGLALLVPGIRPLRRADDRPLRTVAFVALMIFAIHGFVDVSGHRVGTMFQAIFVMGLALRWDEDGSGPWRVPARWPAPVFRCVGAILLAVGLTWIAAAQGWVLVPGQQGVEALDQAANRAIQRRDEPAIERDMNRALAWEPLGWRLYFRRGDARAYLPGQTEAAAQDFRRARYLEPFLGELPMDETLIWLTAGQPDLALSALLEACRREPDRAGEFVGRAVQTARALFPGDPDFVERLGRIAVDTPAILLAFLDQLEPPQSVQFVAACVRQSRSLGELPPTGKTRFFRFWANRGDTRALAEAMNRRPDWQKLGWRWWAEGLAHDGDFQQACAIAQRMATPPRIPSIAPSSRSLEAMEQDADATPGDAALALQISGAQTRAGRLVDAFNTLRRSAGQPDAPVYLRYLEAGAAAAAGRWDQAWEAWEEYLHAGAVEE